MHEPQTARIATLPTEYANHPSRGLTPYRLAQILEEAERGNLQAQADLFSDMEEKDAHIFSEISKRKNAILTIPWKIEPAENATPAEKDDAAWLTEIITQVSGFNDCLLAMMDGIGFGYANVEMEWGLTEKQWIPDKLHHRPASWFRLAQFNQDELRLRDSSPLGAELIPMGWIKHVHRAKSGYVARCGLHRVLAWPYLFKNFAIRDLAELLEIYGIPIRLGTYPTGTGEKEKATLLRAVTEIGHAAAGIIPEGMKIEFEQAARGTHDPHLAMSDWAERSVSKAVLGGTLTSQADGKSSTNALGTVHNEVRHDLRDSDAKQVAATIGRDLFYSLLALNRPNANPRRLPLLVFDTSEKEDFTTFATALPNLVDVGTPIPVTWVQKKLGIPAPLKDEPILVRVPGTSAANIKGKAQGLSAFAALTAKNQQAPADRQAVTLEQDTADAWQAVVSHIASLVNEAESLPALQATLLNAYAGLPLEDLQAVMAQGIAAALAAGMYEVKAGR
ncbi:DUF935 domain-containing protein [Undibacterium sp. Ji83W]|uniref:DUF935 domain-containing protein n=1 Tax=Undibacterium sp. Ji83W TaxID=3413043 RepID=UPI003BF072BD